MPRAAALAKHADLSADLAVHLIDLGDIRAAITQAQAGVWEGTTHLNITERRETIRYAAADLEAEAAKTIGVIEALRARLAHLDLQVRYSHADA